jgi:hypothetical protein
MKVELLMLKSRYRRVVNRMSRPASETHDNLELRIHAGRRRLVIYGPKLPQIHSESQLAKRPPRVLPSTAAVEWLPQPGTQDAVRQGTTQPKGLMITNMSMIG